MADFNWVDYIILAILFFSVLAGFARGIIKELLSLLTWVVAFIASMLFAHKLAEAFSGSSSVHAVTADISTAVGVNAEPSITMLSLGISFVSIFLVILVLGSLLSYVIGGAVEGVGLGFINRFFGGIFGFARGVLINLVFIFIIQLTTYAEASWWKDSSLIAYYQPMVLWMEDLVSPDFKSNFNHIMDKTAQSLFDKGSQYRA